MNEELDKKITDALFWANIYPPSNRTVQNALFPIIDVLKIITKQLDDLNKPGSVTVFKGVEQRRGCYSYGFCNNCQIIVGDPTCFCSGGPCPKCGRHIHGIDNFPENLTGIFEKYVHGKYSVKFRLEKGKWKETIQA